MMESAGGGLGAPSGRLLFDDVNFSEDKVEATIKHAFGGIL